MDAFAYLLALLVILCVVAFAIVFRLVKDPADRILGCLIMPGLCWMIVHKVFLATVHGSAFTSDLDRMPTTFDRANWLYVIGDALAPVMLLAIVILFFKYLVKLVKSKFNDSAR